MLLNSNPETVSTDYDTSDRLYLEPVTLERALDVCALEQPLGVVVTLGGQTPLSLAHALAEEGVPLLGDPLPAIDAAEDRGKFGLVLEELALRAPRWGVADTREEALVVAGRIGYPVLVRPHYVLGGLRMRVVRSPEELEIHEPALVDEFLEHAIELDVDILCDGGGCLGRGDPRARRAGRRPLRRLGLRDPRPVGHARARGGDRRARPPALAPPERARPAQSPARAQGGRAVRDRGEPARVADRPVRGEGDRECRSSISPAA